MIPAISIDVVNALAQQPPLDDRLAVHRRLALGHLGADDVAALNVQDEVPV